MTEKTDKIRQERKTKKEDTVRKIVGDGKLELVGLLWRNAESGKFFMGGIPAFSDDFYSLITRFQISRSETDDVNDIVL